MHGASYTSSLRCMPSVPLKLFCCGHNLLHYYYWAEPNPSSSGAPSRPMAMVHEMLSKYSNTFWPMMGTARPMILRGDSVMRDM